MTSTEASPVDDERTLLLAALTVQFRRATHQAIAAGRSFMFLPWALLDRHDELGWDAAQAAGVAGRCYASTQAAPDEGGEPDVAWCGSFSCLLELNHDGDCGWPSLDDQVAMVASFREQMDPVRRIERRVAFEMTQVDDEAGMPPACPG